MKYYTTKSYTISVYLYIVYDHITYNPAMKCGHLQMQHRELCTINADKYRSVCAENIMLVTEHTQSALLGGE